MAKDKKVVIFMSRDFTLNRKDKEPVVLRKGVNKDIDADVGEHPMIKALVTSAPLEDQGDVIETLKAQVAIETKRADAAEAKVVELQAAIDALTAPKK